MNLPESWIHTKVGSVVGDIQPGFAQKPGDEDDGTTPQIRTHNVTPDGKISLEGIKHVTASENELARYSLEVGDVVFNNTNSQEWVGKTAVFDRDEEYVFSNHMTRLRVHQDLVFPEYLAGYLQLLWSMGYAKTRAKRWVSQAGIESSTLASFKIPLPTIPEQRRIVSILQQAEAVTKAKISLSSDVDELIRTAYWEFFGAWFSDGGLINPVRISECIADSQYGVSEAMDETGTHVVLRMNSITSSGWIDLSELKYASLSKKDIDATQLQDGDLIFNRTNSRELVGKCAIWREVEGKFSFASYLIRLRLKPNMLPEYLWATLNSTYGKYRLFNSAKQAVSMANVSPTDLGRITVPLPPLKLQKKFANFVREVENLRSQMLCKLEAYSELQEVVIQRALIGDLTERWRHLHANEISEAVMVRDALLKESGAKISVEIDSEISGKASVEKHVHQNRHWLWEELSEFQRRLLAAFNEFSLQSSVPLLVEDPVEFARFCDDDTVTELLQPFGGNLGNRIRRTMSQLAALGLLAKITLPQQNSKTGEIDYLKAFRTLRPEELTKLSDLNDLREEFLSDDYQQPYYFEMSLDYETSMRAGAGGMFQVITLQDEEGKDFTHLVDNGTHYTSIEELKEDIARALGVKTQQIVLEEV